MSGQVKRRPGPVRQLSLQQPPRRALRKQASEHWGDSTGPSLRVLASSIVTPGEPAASRKERDAQPAVVRPRPVRLAWTERRPASVDTAESVPPVGVIVQRVRGQPRPVTAKPARLAAHPESILYSRQQLAERLRLAWKDRQERPNLDIFLAHNGGGKVEDDPVLSVREIITEVEKTSSEESSNKKFTPLTDIVNTSSELFATPFRQPRDEPLERPKFTVSSNHSFPTATFPLAAFRESSDSEREKEPPPPTSRRPKFTPSITISFDQGSDSELAVNENDSEENTLRSPSHESNSVNIHLLSPDSYSRSELLDKVAKEQVEEETLEDQKVVKEPDKPKESLTATMRRANFRNMNNNPVMSGSISASSTPTTPVGTKPVLKKPSAQPLTRMMSAPATGRSTPPRGILRESSAVVKGDVEGDEDDFTIVQRERNIKSAPARRRFKNTRRKGPKSHEDDSSEDELNFEEPQPAKPKPRKRVVERSADIVTMVSLLSPAESEAEEAVEPVIQLPQVQPPEAVPGMQDRQPLKETKPAAVTTNIVDLRSKFAAKTVSFQGSGASAGRSYTASYPSRRGGGAGLVLPPPEPPPLSTAPPPPLTLARRRLVKAKSVGALGQENSCESQEPPAEESAVAPVPLPPPPTVPPVPARVSPPTTTTTEPEPDPSVEPPFKTDKERECWQMFRKMADKGVSVSYDTVLRGMLTPTEYRLHKKSLSSMG